MATETEQLVVTLEARINQFEKSFAKANATANKNWNAIEARGKQAATRMQADMGRAVMGVNRSLAGLGAGLSLVGAQRLVDSSTRITNALKVAGLSGDDLTKVYDELFASAQKNAAPFESLVQLYGRASLVQKELGVSTQDLLKFTDNIAVALRVSGKSAQESTGALLQLSQALGSGVVRAEEFNSMLEGALPIVQAAASGITDAGGSVAKLRKLVVDGKVSSEAFFKGFQAGAVTLEQKVANATLTVAQGFTRLENAAIDAAKRINETAGVGRTAANVLDALSFVVVKLANAFILLSQDAGASKAADDIDKIGAAARNLWNDPSFQNLYRFLFDTSESKAQSAAADAIAAKANAYTMLADAMRKASAETTAVKKGTATKFDETFAAFAPKKVSLSDFPVTDKKKDDGVEAKDAFEKESAQIAKRIALLGAEIATIDQNTYARERAKAVVELESAAKKANEEAGKDNTEVTVEQRVEINKLADAYAKTKAQLDTLHGPLATFARESANVGKQIETLAASSLDRLSDDLADVVMGTKTAAEAFKSMADFIIKELLKIAAKQLLLAPLAGLLGGTAAPASSGAGGIFGTIGSLFGGAREAGGPVTAGKAYIVGEKRPELFVPKTSGTILPNLPAAIVPRPAAIGGGNLQQANTFNVTVTGSAGTAEQNQDLADRMGRQLKETASAMVTKELRLQMRPGGILRR